MLYYCVKKKTRGIYLLYYKHKMSLEGYTNNW